MSKVEKRNVIRVFLISVLSVMVIFSTTVLFSAYASDNENTPSTSDVSSEETSHDESDETIVIYEETVEGKNYRFKPNAVYNGNFRSELLSDELPIYDAMYRQCVTNKSSDTIAVDFSGRGYIVNNVDAVYDMILSAYAAFTLDHPEVFWISGYHTDSILFDENDYITQINFTLNESYPNAFDDINKVYSGISSAVNSISADRASASRYDTVKAIHDYICNNVTYDNYAYNTGDYAEDQTVAPLFGGGRRGKTFVCSGYASSFKLLCDKFGIPCVKVEGGDHSWNYAKMEDGKWYAVDVTWDDDDEIEYTYFLVGSNTFNNSHTPHNQIMNTDTIYPLAYPPLSNEKYVRFDFWGDCTEDYREISDQSQFWWKYNSLSPSGCDVNISLDDVHLATIYMDENGYFSYLLDTTLYANGEHIINAVYRGTDGTEIKVSRTIMINNSFFGFWDWHGDNPTVTGDFIIWLKQVNYGNESNCDVNIFIDGIHQATCYCDSNGFFSHVIDTFNLNNGDHLLEAIFRNKSGIEIKEEKYFHVENPSFEIWDWAENNPTFSGTYKVWMKQCNCGSKTDHDVNVYIDDVHYKTLYCDDNGFFSYEIDTTTLINGQHTFKAILRTKSGFELTDYRIFTVQNIVVPTAIILNTSSVTIFEGNHIPISARIKPDNATEKAITWTSSDTSIATVDSNGTVTAIQPGNATITASIGTLSAACTVTVQAKPTSYPVKISKSTLNLTITDNSMRPTATLTAQKPRSIKKVVWCSDDPDIASVSQTGKVTVYDPGVANIYCTSESGEILSAPCEIRVRYFVIDPYELCENESFAVSNNIYCLPYTNSGKINLIDSDDSSESIVWKSSNSRIISVSQDGYIQCLGKKGTVTITASRGKTKTSVKFRAYQTTQSLNLNYSNFWIYAGKTLNMKAIQSKGADEPVFWESLDPSVVSINEKGQLKGISQGTATIRARSASGVETQTDVLIRTKATGFTWSTVPTGMIPRGTVKYGLNVGSTKDLYATITSPANCNDTVTWSTSNKSVVEISATLSSGKGVRIKGLKKGTATVTAKTGSGKKVTYRISVVPEAAQQIQLNKNAVLIYTGAAVSLSAKILPKGCNDVVMWKSSDTSVATVDENGKVTAKSQGQAVVTAYSSLTGTAYDTANIYVLTKATGFTWDTIPDGLTPRSTVKYAMGVNDDMDLAVKITSPVNCNDYISWSSSNRKVVEIFDEYEHNNIIRIHAYKKGTATITARTGSGKKVTYQITVMDKVNPDILLNKHSATIYKGSALALSAKVTPKGSVILWKSSNPSVATVDENGKVTGISNGTTTITAYPGYANNGYHYDQAEIKVITKATSVSVNSTSVSLGVGYTFNAIATVAPAGCGDTLTWTSSNKAIATVTPSGEGSAVIQAVKPGKCTVTVKTGSGKTMKITVTVHS